MDTLNPDPKCTYCGGAHLSAQHPIPLPKLACAACFLERHGGEVNPTRGGTKHICGKPGVAKLCNCIGCLRVRNPPEPKCITLEVIKDAAGCWYIPLASGELTTVDRLVSRFQEAWPEHQEFSITLHVKERG